LLIAKYSCSFLLNAAKAEIFSMDNSIECLEALIASVEAAQAVYATYSQTRVDHIFKMAALAANAARLPLAKQAVAETGMGVVEDKVIKNHFASEIIYNKYKHEKTCGIIEADPVFGP
jgi:acetaldehyde dehydrogenase/alcohol dehydrogenase